MKIPILSTIVAHEFEIQIHPTQILFIPLPVK